MFFVGWYFFSCSLRSAAAIFKFPRFFQHCWRAARPNVLFSSHFCSGHWRTLCISVSLAGELCGMRNWAQQRVFHWSRSRRASWFSQWQQISQFATFVPRSNCRWQCNIDADYPQLRYVFNNVLNCISWRIHTFVFSLPDKTGLTRFHVGGKNSEAHPIYASLGKSLSWSYLFYPFFSCWVCSKLDCTSTSKCDWSRVSWFGAGVSTLHARPRCETGCRNQ